MMARFTDNARAVIRTAFHGNAANDLRAILNVLRSQRGGPADILTAAGVDIDRLPTDYSSVERTELIKTATDLAKLRGKPYVGTEHVLLALARLNDPALAAPYERLEELLSAAEDKWRRAHPPVARRLGTWCRAGLKRAAGWIHVGKR
jgi:Clp amino terminal domain, pathogenicity island component